MIPMRSFLGNRRPSVIWRFRNTTLAFSDDQVGASSYDRLQAHDISAYGVACTVYDLTSNTASLFAYVLILYPGSIPFNRSYPDTKQCQPEYIAYLRRLRPSYVLLRFLHHCPRSSRSSCRIRLMRARSALNSVWIAKSGHVGFEMTDAV